jgi:hypothetical protein
VEVEPIYPDEQEEGLSVIYQICVALARSLVAYCQENRGLVIFLNGLSVIDDIDDNYQTLERILEPRKNPECGRNSVCFVNDGRKERIYEGLMHIFDSSRL